MNIPLPLLLSYHLLEFSGETCFVFARFVFEHQNRIIMAEVAGGQIPSHHNKDQLAVEHEHDRASFSSDETQTGVKNIEAVSQTWTQRSLIAAYVG